VKLQVCIFPKMRALLILCFSCWDSSQTDNSILITSNCWPSFPQIISQWLMALLKTSKLLYTAACPCRLSWFWCSRWWKQNMLEETGISVFHAVCILSAHASLNFCSHLPCITANAHDTETDLIMLLLVAVKKVHRFPNSIVIPYTVPKFLDVMMKTELWFGVASKKTCFCEF
jgi:hypothetical protein